LPDGIKRKKGKEKGKRKKEKRRSGLRKLGENEKQKNLPIYSPRWGLFTPHKNFHLST